MRAVATVLCSAALLAVMVANTAVALNQYQDIFVTLSARPLAMGGAAAAVPQPASVFYNPAALASVRRLTVMWNHSARHFGWTDKGGWAERDQLDGDTEAIVVPLPLCTYAHGWVAKGEYGYDYRNHPADGSLGFPREWLNGCEDYDALAFGTGMPISLGIAQRRSFHRFSPAPEDPATPAWIRLGEGIQWGIYARVFPGLDYGRSELKHDYEWSIFPAGMRPASSAVTNSNKTDMYVAPPKDAIVESATPITNESLAVGRCTRCHDCQFKDAFDLKHYGELEWHPKLHGTEWRKPVYRMVAKDDSFLNIANAERILNYLAHGTETEFVDSQAPQVFQSRVQSRRTGSALHPTGWLTLANDDMEETYTYRDAENYFGFLHEGDQQRTHSHVGGELRLGWLGAYRWGSRDGQPTCGLALNLCGLQLNYAEVAGLLPEIVGAGEHWKDVHVYGAELSLW